MDPSRTRWSHPSERPYAHSDQLRIGYCGEAASWWTSLGGTSPRGQTALRRRYQLPVSRGSRASALTHPPPRGSRSRVVSAPWATFYVHRLYNGVARYQYGCLLKPATSADRPTPARNKMAPPTRLTQHVGATLPLEGWFVTGSLLLRRVRGRTAVENRSLPSLKHHETNASCRRYGFGEMIG